ncbi:hypothetical protein B0J18DRAFT_43824 [Chaetomium sp. MPI-SDFR-AT-0129]|nr:hypothetical protein B0J18DRAFT_43824 [Chaetomium sp. MPI-SDFR-AT-0129]
MAPTIKTPPRAAAPSPIPAPVVVVPNNNNDLLPRQDNPTPPIQTATIPANYGALHSGPDPGAVAGITLGAVAGFVLLLWLVYTIVNLGNPSSGTTVADTSTVVTEGTGSVYTRRRRRSSHRRGAGGSPVRVVSRSRSRSRSHTATTRRYSHRGKAETVEIRRGRGGSGGPVIVEEVVTASSPPMAEVDRVIIEERSRRRRSISRPVSGGPMPPPPRHVLSSDSESESSRGGTDENEVVVIEEHSPPRRTRRGSRVRSVERSSGFREVDPERFAGGDAPFVDVRRSGSRR